ncbi:hypothetical protein [Thermogutta sp.]|uniref:hypothetical protein n=1 Tax=Thermogutta sp. TaxID=1962930 RepID=UPI003220641B
MATLKAQIGLVTVSFGPEPQPAIIKYIGDIRIRFGGKTVEVNTEDYGGIADIFRTSKYIDITGKLYYADLKAWFYASGFGGEVSQLQNEYSFGTDTVVLPEGKLILTTSLTDGTQVEITLDRVKVLPGEGDIPLSKDEVASFPVIFRAVQPDEGTSLGKVKFTPPE